MVQRNNAAITMLMSFLPCLSVCLPLCLFVYQLVNPCDGGINPKLPFAIASVQPIVATYGQLHLHHKREYPPCS